MSSQERPAERSKTSKLSGRLRTACNFCHRAKIKCSGKNPCLVCEVSQLHCTYSSGNQVGRPKGSKNKRKLMQEKGRRLETSQEVQNNSGADALQWTDSGQQQQNLLPDLNQPLEFDVEHGFESSRREYLIMANSPDALPSPNLASLMNSIEGARVHVSSEEALTSFFAQSSATLTQPLYRTPPFETSDISKCDSEYATSTIRPFADNPTLPSRQSSVFSVDKPRHQGTLMPLEPRHCECLQKLVQLVYELEDQQYSHAGDPTIDRVLQGVQLSQAAWRSLMQCSQCQSRDDQKEVFLLFAMSIRTLLSSIHKLNMSPYRADNLHEIPTGQTSSRSADMGVLVGSFELTGEIKAEVIRMAIRKALKSVINALLYLWERTGQPRPSPCAGLGISNSGPKSPDHIITSISTETQRWPSENSFPLANLGAENIGSLLDSLQCTMRAMR